MEPDTESLWRQLTEAFQQLTLVEDWGDYLKRRGALEEGVTTEQFQAIAREYFTEIEARIARCEAWVKERPIPQLHYALAHLYNHCDAGKSAAYFYKRPVRYHALKALRLNPQQSTAWVLLAEVYSWIAFIGGETDEIPTVTLDPEYRYTPELETKPAITEPASYVEEAFTLSGQQQRQIRAHNQAIRCMMKAIQLEPGNEAYQEQLRAYSHCRNEEYKPTSVPRTIGHMTAEE